MAYLHCHTKNCGWSQDDFWNFTIKKKLFKWSSRPFGYNPLSLILEDVAYYIKPRMIQLDRMFVLLDAIELQNYTGIKVKFTSDYKCFSWSWLLLNIVKNIKKSTEMKWLTYKSWKNDFDKGKAKCPKCGKINFDID